MRVYLDNCCFNRPYDEQSFLRQEPFDYTEWRQGLYKDVPLEQFLRDAQEYRERMG